jgi:hypothetical protein
MITGRNITGRMNTAKEAVVDSTGMPGSVNPDVVQTQSRC